MKRYCAGFGRIDCDNRRLQRSVTRQFGGPGQHELAFDIYRKLQDREANFVFSPYSISTGLAMLYAGARGRTAEEIAQVGHFTLSAGQLHFGLRRFAPLLLRRAKDMLANERSYIIRSEDIHAGREANAGAIALGYVTRSGALRWGQAGWLCGRDRSRRRCPRRPRRQKRARPLADRRRAASR